MSDKFVFQNAIVKCMESKLLNIQSVQRLLDCASNDEAFKTLIDIGFGGGLAFEGNDFDALFDAEDEKLVAFLKQFNVDKALDVFLLQYDYLNLKAILKASVQNSQSTRLSPSGLFDEDMLKLWVADCNDENIPSFIKGAICDVNALVESGKAMPHAIDSIVDKAMYRHILSVVKKSGKLAKAYFISNIDYINISSFVRVKKLGLPFEFYRDGFIEGGELQLQLFERAFEQGLDIIKEGVKHTRYEDVVNKVCDDMNIVAFEVAKDNALLKMWKDEKNDLFSIAPIVAYYLTKTTEIKLAKLIVAGIKNHVDPQIIKERMREIYA